MKKIILLALTIFSTAAVAIVALKPISLSKTVAATGTPEAITATKTLSPTVFIQAKPGNTQNVTIGDSVAQHYVLIPGASINLTDGAFNQNDYDFDLSKIYVKVLVNGEGVNVFYVGGPLN